MVASIQYQPGTPLSKRQNLELLWSQLKNERSTWESHWRDLADYILPRRIRLHTTERNKGDKRNQRIIDSTATFAARSLRSGLMAGVTSPARPWKQLTTPDPTLAEFGPVKTWLADVNRLMDTLFLKSNLYNALPILYGDLGVFGTGAMAALEDDRDTMRFYTFPVGSYAVSANERQVIDTFVREVPMTVRQIVQKFGRVKEKSGSADWSNISQTVRNLWDNRNLEAVVDVMHAVYPNQDFDDSMVDPKFKRFSSCYYELGSTENRFLRESGFDQFPILCPRWDVMSEDIYGTSPAMDVLGDVKALQLLQKRKSQAVEKMVNPPMTGPSSLRNQKASLLPGDITYVDVREGQQGFRPVHEVRMSIAEVMGDIQEHQERIRRAFFEDLFLMLTLSDRRDITATEIAERKEEKLLMLGPVLERLNDELLDPLVDRAFNVMAGIPGMLPEAPEELQGVDLRVEYVSIMAQAQKLVSTSGIQRTMTFVAELAAASQNQSIWDKVDVDQAIDEFGDAVSAPVRIIRSDEDVAAIREQRQQREQMAQNVALMEQAASGMQKLSQANTEGDNALTNLASAMAGGGVS